MTKLSKGDLVVKHFEDLVLMGRFLEYSRTSQGRLVALFETPEKWIFGSDPSHLEKVNILPFDVSPVSYPTGVKITHQ